MVSVTAAGRLYKVVNKWRDHSEHDVFLCLAGRRTTTITAKPAPIKHAQIRKLGQAENHQCLLSAKLCKRLGLPILAVSSASHLPYIHQPWLINRLEGDT